MNLQLSLESESFDILREAAAYAREPIMLCSLGRDSSVMLHLTRTAYYPATPALTLLHVDRCWRFQAMRDQMLAKSGTQLPIHTNTEGSAEGIGPLTHGGSYHTDVMKAQTLKQALDANGFDVVFGSARRNGKNVRSKEQGGSFRASGHRWGPKAETLAVRNTKRQGRLMDSDVHSSMEKKKQEGYF